MISRRNILAGAVATAGVVATGAAPAVAAPSAAGKGRSVLRVASPTVEYVRHPLGLDVARPRLSWPLTAAASGQRQSAYQVRVASSAARLPRPDVWDSGRVASAESVLVPYDGPGSSRVRATTGRCASGTPTEPSRRGARRPGGRPA
ncbi:hypothetical protein ACR6C2_17905 [Streptomyces sp. INA 01156]